jgi:hypothetical protein
MTNCLKPITNPCSPGTTNQKSEGFIKETNNQGVMGACHNHNLVIAGLTTNKKGHLTISWLFSFCV